MSTLQAMQWDRSLCGCKKENCKNRRCRNCRGRQEVCLPGCHPGVTLENKCENVYNKVVAEFEAGIRTNPVFDPSGHQSIAKTRHFVAAAADVVRFTMQFVYIITVMCGSLRGMASQTSIAFPADPKAMLNLSPWKHLLHR